MMSKKTYRLLFVVLAAAVTFTDCHKDPPVKTNDSTTNEKVDRWIRSELNGWYYWNDALNATTPPSLGTLEYDQYLEQSIRAIPAAKSQDNSESPPTIDGVWKKNEYGVLTMPLTRGEEIYSYVEREKVGTRAEEGTETTFGFDFTRFYTNGSPYFTFLVRWVQPGGPAEKAGLRRGMWITKYNGALITQAAYVKFFYQLHLLEGGNTMSFTVAGGKGANSGAEKQLTITAETMKVSPILQHGMLASEERNRQVAYLMYNSFTRGADWGGDRFEFEEELRNVFGEFKKAGANELVLDLRYNLGGYLSSCQVLASLAGNVGPNQIFAQLKRHDNIGRVWRNAPNPQVENFLNEPNSLKLNKIYILATQSSASASEVMINSLRGVLGNDAVVVIGTDTNGKNVGMDLRETTIEGYKYSLWPITFKILNANGFCDYAGGFQPDVYVDEFLEVASNPTAILRSLGDPGERLLAAALATIDGRTVTPDPRPGTRAATQKSTELPHPEIPSRGGAKYIPPTQQ
jgi:C-terminal processing protease CtpA/Prc